MLDKIINNRVLNIVENFDKSSIKYDSQNNISINDIKNIWKDFVNTKYYKKNRIVSFSNKKDISSLRIALNEPILSETLILLFQNHMNSIKEDLLLFFFKKSNKMLLKLKSFHPLLNKKNISLPYWEKTYNIDDLPQYKNIFKENNYSDLVILFYT